MKPVAEIIWHETLDSTQEEVRRHISELANLSVTAAGYQTAGKGQRGNRWDSARGENLMFSILLKPGSDGIPKIEARRQFIISMISSLAVRDALEEYGIGCRIKWPNDIYVGNKKICGMLIENQLSGNMLASSIIGIGLNVNQTDFPSSLLNPTSMALRTGRSFKVEEVLDCVIKHFLKYLKEDAGALENLYHNSLFRLEEYADYVDTLTAAPLRGKIKGITEDALLILELPDGTVRHFSFKEISYVL